MCALRIALVSAPVKNKNVRFNLQAMLDALAAVRNAAELVVFGESVLQGFDCLSWNYEEDKAVAVSLNDEPILKMRQAAKEYAVAVSFGFIERVEGLLYSSQIFIGANGEIQNLFHRVSVGWKDYTKTDDHYREGQQFETFFYSGISFSVGLCGDLWTEGRAEEMKTLAPPSLRPCPGFSRQEGYRTLSAGDPAAFSSRDCKCRPQNPPPPRTEAASQSSPRG